MSKREIGAYEKRESGASEIARFMRQKKYFDIDDADNPHPWYGGCDMMGPRLTCAECNKISPPWFVRAQEAILNYILPPQCYRTFFVVVLILVGVIVVEAAR